MKLVVLDSFAAVSTDLSLDCLKPYCDEIAVYERTPADMLLSRIGDAEAILINKTVITRDIMEQCPNLKYIGLFATGYNVVDIQAAKERGIVVANAPAYSTNAVAQLTFGLILHFYCLIALHDARVHTGEWTNVQGFLLLRSAHPRTCWKDHRACGLRQYCKKGRFTCTGIRYERAGLVAHRVPRI